VHARLIPKAWPELTPLTFKKKGPPKGDPNEVAAFDPT
jgi:hypothetical protein